MFTSRFIKQTLTDTHTCPNNLARLEDASHVTNGMFEVADVKVKYGNMIFSQKCCFHLSVNELAQNIGGFVCTGTWCLYLI